MALTPSTNNDARPWHLTQKSYLTANNASSISTNVIIRNDHTATTPEVPKKTIPFTVAGALA